MLRGKRRRCYAASIRSVITRCMLYLQRTPFQAPRSVLQTVGSCISSAK